LKKGKIENKKRNKGKIG